jgi:hypothetical protein
MRTSHVPKNARNGNQGSILAYSIFGQFLATGLIAAFLIPFFQIPVIRAWNQKSPILPGEKPALLFPFGWQIVFQMGRSWERKKGLFLRIGNSPEKLRRKPARLLHSITF